MCFKSQTLYIAEICDQAGVSKNEENCPKSLFRKPKKA